MKMTLFLFALFPFICKPQTFEKVYTEFGFQRPNDLIEHTNGYIISVHSGSEDLDFYHLRIVQIDKMGNIVGELLFQEPIARVQANLLALSDSTFMVVCFNRNEEGYMNLVYRKLDFSLNLIYENTLELNPTAHESQIVYSKICKLDANIILHTVGTYSPYEEIQRNLHLIKLNINLDDLFVNNYQRSDFFIPKSLLAYQTQDTAMLIFPDKVYKIDSNACIVDSFPDNFLWFNYPNMIVKTPTSSAFWLNNQLYISGTSYTIGRFNSDFSQDTLIRFESGESHRTAFNEPLSGFGDNTYLGGIIGFNAMQYGEMYWGQNSYIRLYRNDINLVPIWKKNYKQYSGYYYFVFNILATSDGGCLLAATRNNIDTQGQKVDLYLLKVDSLGNYTPMVGLENPTTTTYTLVYPNPGTTTLTIETVEGTAGNTFRMYNSTGTLMLQQLLQAETETIDVSNLPSGMYIYETQNYNGTVERGKWVKME